MPTRELEVELRVRSHPLLVDRLQFARREAGLGDVDGPTHDRERECEHDLVRRHGLRLRALLEGERVRAGSGSLHGDELGAGRDLSLEGRAEARRNLIVPAAHVVLLVRLPEHAELARADVTEEVDEVERALLARLRAVLDVVRDVQQLTQPRRDPARYELLDPVDDREAVELVSALRVAVEERRVAGGGEVRVERLPDLFQVVRHRGERVRRAVEVADDLGAVRLALVQVVEVETELVDEAPELVVTLVDELAAVLVDLAVGEEPAAAPAPPAEARRRLVHLCAVARLLQAVRTGQAREPRAHHDDVRRRRCASRGAETREAGYPETGEACLLEQLRAHYTALSATRADEPATETVSVAGLHCESGDVLIDDVALPPTRVGDLLAVPATGAYTLAMSSNYNATPRPAAVLVRDGDGRLIRRRETVDDLLALEPPPDAG